MNILPNTYVITTTSAITGYSNLVLSQDDLLSISSYSLNTSYSGVTVTGTRYIGMEIQLPVPMPCSGITIYSNNEAVGYLKVHTQDYGSGTWKWYTPSGIGGGIYSTSLTTLSGLSLIRIFYATASGSLYTKFYGVDLNTEAYITISGSSDQIGYTNTMKRLYITNLSNVVSPAKVVPRYTSYLTIDKYSRFSKDYDTSAYKETASWEGFDNSFTVPEIHPWSLGVSNNLQEYRRELLLMTSGISGTWVSPIIDTQNDPAYAYLYGAGKISKSLSLTNSVAEIRSSDTSPALACFLVTTTEPTHQTLMYKHKRVHLDSKGNVIAKVECNAPVLNNKIWRNADTTFAGKPLHFCGSINKFGTASFLAPGVVSCSVADPVAIKGNYDYWYRLCSSTFESSNYWANGISVSGIDWGDSSYVVYTKTFPTSTSLWVAAAIVTDPTVPSTSVFLSCVESGGVTRFCMPVLSLPVSVSGVDYYSMCTAPSINGWWTHVGANTNKVYKMDFSGLDSIQRWGISSSEPAKFYESYSEIYTVATGIRSIVEIPMSNYSGFWAVCDNKIRLYKETSLGLGELRTYNNSLLNTGFFGDLYQGATDSMGNLWAVDIAQQRVVRVNFDRSQRGDTNAIDFDMTISGAIGVYAHPTDGTAYVLITNEPAHPNVDVIRQINSTQVSGTKTQFVCTVSGFSSSPYKYGTHFTGFCFTDYIRPYSGDSVWGSVGSLGWKDYLVGKKYLPYGRYKQIKVTLLRSTVNDSSPHLSAVRIPKAIILNMGKTETKILYYKLDVENITLSSSFDMNVDVIFVREE